MNETKERCKETVYPNETYGAFHGHQCTRNVWKDGYCKTHHPETVKARDEKRRQKWAEQQANSPYAAIARLTAEKQAALSAILADAAGQLPDEYAIHIHINNSDAWVTLERPDESVDLINGESAEECVKEAVRQAVSHAESANMEAADKACADKCRDQAMREDEYERQRRGE
jgi:hypothetical protein